MYVFSLEPQERGSVEENTLNAHLVKVTPSSGLM